VRYVQYLVEPTGRVIAEVISNLNIGDAVALSSEDEERLRSAGWSEPSPGPKPNWRYEADDSAGLMKIVSMSRDVVYDVLRERDANAVSVRIFEGIRSESVRGFSRPDQCPSPRSTTRVERQLEGVGSARCAFRPSYNRLGNGDAMSMHGGGAWRGGRMGCVRCVRTATSSSTR